MRCHRLRAVFVAAVVAAALAATPALAQQGEPIGWWWLLDMSGEAAPRHAIMTMSTQGSGVAFQCAGGRSSVLLGMNKPEFRPEAGATVALEYQIDGGSRHRAQAALTSAETLEFDEAVSDAIIAAAAEASSFSFHLPQAATEVTLVFRPVETKDAIARMRAACAKPAPTR